jgi:hypothetical protein
LPPLLGLYASCAMADREKAIEVFKRKQTGHSELDDGDVIDRGKNDSGHACHLFPLSCNPSSLELRENRRPTYKSDGAKR